LELKVPRKQFLAVMEEDGTSTILPDERIEHMHEWSLDPLHIMTGWVSKFEEYGVYFSTPLDLDFMMLQKFPSEYQATGDRGPRIPKADDPKRDEAVKEVITAVLKQGTDGGTYTDEEKEAFFWYRYLFL